MWSEEMPHIPAVKTALCKNEAVGLTRVRSLPIFYSLELSAECTYIFHLAFSADQPFFTIKVGMLISLVRFITFANKTYTNQWDCVWISLD